MSYNNATGVITAPVSIDDVKTCLGLSTNDVATLCTSDKINMWAKYKPTRYAAPFPDDWYKANDGNYGLNLNFPGTAVTSVADLVALYSKVNNGYPDLYLKPTGGSSSPYRLGDFRGYNKNAKPEVTDILGVNVFVESDGYQLGVEHSPVRDDGDALSYTQIAQFKNTYFGFTIYTESGTYVAMVTAAKTLAEGDYSVLLTAKKLSAGTYIAYPMFCTANYSTQSGGKVHTLYAVPNLVPKKFKVTTATDPIMKKIEYIKVNRDTSNTYITVQIKTKTGYSLTGISVYCVFNTSEISSTAYSLKVGEQKKAMANITQGGKSTVFFNIVDTSKTYAIWVYAESNWLIKGMLPSQNADLSI